ncbi:hypothetical protein B0H14DRAFT_2609494 [Mycena olivaceomarginata]|nr:hypothetical protein B0H14DRAFT_2609494 [Mycena olivaceomarginata]
MLISAIAIVTLVCLVVSATYQWTDNIDGSGFLSAFSFQAISDPTHGQVNYANAQTAASQNLTFASTNSFIVRADSKTVLNLNRPGRNSVRLQSNKQFTTAVTIFNVKHVSQGCGQVYSYSVDSVSLTVIPIALGLHCGLLAMIGPTKAVAIY